jgi:hypothetical protein
MNIKRMRGRGGHRHGGGGQFRQGGGGGGGSNGSQPLNRNHVFDSNGPDLRLRGTAQQLFEKYLQLGRDATSGGDRVMAEGYFQHAEHYFRILNAMNQAAMQHQQYQQRRSQPQDGQDGPDGPEGQEGGEQPEYRGEAQTITPDLNESGAEVVAPAKPAPAPEAA